MNLWTVEHFFPHFLARPALFQNPYFKVHIFWEGHKILWNLHLTFNRMHCTVVKSKVEISQNFVAFSEYMNFTYIKLNNIANFFFFISLLFQLIRKLAFRFRRMKVKTIAILPDKVEQWVIWAGKSELISWKIRLIFFYDHVLKEWKINSLLPN